MKRLLLALSLALVAPIAAFGQFSFGATFGMAFCLDGPDPYALNSPWNPAGFSGENQQITVYAGASGPKINLSMMYEVSPSFSAGLVYQSVSFTNSESHRSGGSSSIGASFKVNFSPNTKKIVPYFQATYYLTNSNTVKQETATSSTYPTQTQPAFEHSATTSLGFNGDLGMEIQLNDSFSLVVYGGINGIQLTDDDSFTLGLDYGAAYQPPHGFDGAFFASAGAGVKFYTGRGNKKRDF